MSDHLENLFVFGLGYTGLRLIERHGGSFSTVAGTVRAAAKAGTLRKRGIAALAFDSPEAAEHARMADAVLVSVPPNDAGDPVLDRFGDVLAEAKRCRWLGYLSTTGVYGDRGGALTGETTPVQPMTHHSRLRAEAERSWLAWGERNGIAVHVFRLSGIYGPGRNAVEKLLRGEAKRIVKDGQIFNRIHVDDIATVLMASMAKPRPGAIYNVSDDEPAPPQDVILHAAHLLGVEPPSAIAFEDAELSAASRSFYGENKRITNRLLEDEFGVRLAYPTYREGLAALLPL